MGWQLTPFSLPLVGSGVLVATLAVVTARRHDTHSARPLIAVLAATALWCFLDALQVSVTGQSMKLLATKASFFGQIGVTSGIFFFAAVYTNREHWVRPRYVAAVLALPAVTLLLVWTSHLHDLVIQDVALTTGQFAYLQIQWGPWDVVHTGYAYVLLVGAAWMLVDNLRHTRHVSTYRGQTWAILVAMVVPWSLSVAYVLDLPPASLTPVDLTPLGFTATAALVAVALYRYRILEVVPIARSTAIDNVDQGYIVLDCEDTVVDVNETAASMLGADKSALVGRQQRELFEGYPDAARRFEDTRDAGEILRLDIDDKERVFDIEVSPIYDGHDRYSGRVFLFKDATEREQRKRRLERQTSQLETQNERLEEFAGVVAHDMRNPLTAMSARLELLEDEFESEHLDAMAANVERMEALVENVLEMARKGQAVDPDGPVELAAVCEEAWANVDTADATLEVRTDRTVEADHGRLLSVFENLFRNAVQHAGPDVTVTVGDTAEGFFVQDDGPGIPPEDREHVLAEGYTTTDDGTGFGLAIVKTAVQAHGWEIDVTDASSTDSHAQGADQPRDTAGGARFEITGLRRRGDAATRER